MAEILLWQQLKGKQLLELDFDRQKIIGNYIVDFYCKSIGIIIEIDGISHDFKTIYDIQRDNFLRGLGLKIIYLLDRDVKQSLNEVIVYLKKILTFNG